MTSQKFKRNLVVALTFGVLALQGCSMLDPYAKWNRPSIEAVEGYTLPYAIAYAQNARNAYREKLIDHANLTNSVVPGMITLGTAVLGLAAYGVDTDAILGASLGGGALYTLANWYSNSTQELVYVAGMEAMSCVVEAVLPLNFSKDARDRLNNDLGQLNDGISNVLKAISSVRVLLPEADPASALVQASNAAVTSAEQIVQTADQTYAAGSRLHRQTQTIGANLVVAVDRIGVAVDAAVQQSQPRLEALGNIISQLSNASGIFAPGPGLVDTLTDRFQPEEDDSQAEDEKDGKANGIELRIQVAVNALATESSMLASVTRRVRATVNSVNENRPLEALKDCGVNVSEVSADISVSPSRIQVEAGTASENLIIVKGGKSPYVARFMSRPTPGVTVDSPIPGDHVITVSTTEEAKVDEYTLYIADAAEHSKIVTVSVVGEGRQPRGNDKDDASDGAKSNLEALANDIKGKPFSVEGVDAKASFKVESAMLNADNNGVLVKVNCNHDDCEISQDKIIAGIGKIEKNETTVKEFYHQGLGDIDKLISIEGTDG